MTFKTLMFPVTATLLLTACSTTGGQYNGMNSAERSAIVGTAVGAGAGALIAGKGDDAEGLLFGAGLGAAAGYLLGNQRDKRSVYRQNGSTQGYGTAPQGRAYGHTQGHTHGQIHGQAHASNTYSEQNRRYDQTQQRYYFVDPSTGAEYWANGTRRR